MNVNVGVGVRKGVRVGLGDGLAGMKVGVDVPCTDAVSVGVMDGVADWVPDCVPDLVGVPVSRVAVAEGLLVAVGLTWLAAGVMEVVPVGVTVVVAWPGYGDPAGVPVSVP